jgi:glucose uptake protein GlcU
MIQRIQSVYLLLVVIACVAYIFVPFGQIKNTDGTLETWAIKQVVPIMAEDILVAVLALISIFLYKNRKTQMKVVLVNIVLSVVLIGLFLFGLTQHIGIQNYVFKIGAILPVFILIFNMLAYGSIKHDEALVKSMDRLR